MIISLILIIYNYSIYKKEQYKIIKFFTTVENKSNKIENNISYDKFIGILEIPIIGLKQGFYNIDNINNNVDKNIQLIDGSTFPNIDNHLLVLASHSGNGKKSYFKNINKLNINDHMYIYFNNTKYTYETIKKEEVDKIGKISIVHGKENLLILTTCSKTDKTKQLVITNKLINKETY